MPIQSPFSLNPQVQVATKAQPTKPALLSIRTVIGGLALGLVICLGLAIWLKGPQLMSWLERFPSLQMGWLSPRSNQMFVPSAELKTQDEGRKLYQATLIALGDQQNEEALSAFEKLKPHYPGLEELILLHQAEAYANLGQEASVQKTLQTLLGRFPKSPLRHKARYLMGQSHVRAHEPEPARTLFEQLLQQAPKNDYGVGSLYYLGLLNQGTHPSQAVTFWSQYLNQCPDCVFSGDIAEALDRMIEQPTPSQHALIGQALMFSDRQPEKALAHLKVAPLAESWFPLGRAYLKAHQTELGTQTLLSGIRYSQNPDKSQEAVDMLLRNNPANQSVSLLTQLNQLNLKISGDYVLWKLAQLDTEKAQSYYQAILRRYPQGDYAPESSWALLWRLVDRGENTAFLTRAATHMARYPYSRSAPKVQFWMGKVQEETGQPATAKTTYQGLLKQYPDNYYAFRAKGRLQALNKQGDPGWRTRAQASLPLAVSLADVQIMPPQTEFQQQYQAYQQSLADMERTYRAAQELQLMGAADDLSLLVKESLGQLPPAVESWADFQRNERAKAIRVIRDAIQEKRKEANGQYVPTRDELKLLHPVFFSSEITGEARRQGIDPYLVQSLMREESYFNELAVSSSNARGLMQLLPTTAADVAQWEKLDGFNTLSLFQPAVNIRLGTRYLNYLHAQFAHQPQPLVSMASVGAYNGGPNAMKRWIAQSPYFTSDPDRFVESIPYEQTRDYIKKVFGSYWNYQRLYGQASAAN